MTNLKEKVAYLQGLTKGLDVSANSAEGKILLNIIDVLDSVADEFTNMHLMQEELEDYVETIDEDLNDLEEEIYEETGDDYVEVTCPICKEAVTFESSLLEDDGAVEVTCPYCGGVVYDNELEYGEEDDVIDVGNSYSKSLSGIHPGI